MIPAIPSSTRCSAGSAPAFILRPRASRILKLWFFATHSIAVAAAIVVAVPWPLKLTLLTGILVHARVRRPRQPELLVRSPDGAWALPERERAGLIATAGSRYGPWWVFLTLSDGRTSVRVLLLKDQLDGETWRSLQAHLRRRHKAPPLP